MAYEGKSEIAFCAWLQQLCDQNNLHVHLHRPAGMMGGDPLALVKCALDLRNRSKASARVGHRHSCLLIDTDRLDDGSPRSREAIALAQREQLVLIRQRPCFEAVLLRLHQGHERASPSNRRAAENQLWRVWPCYSKPPTRQQLAARFQLLDLQRLAHTDVDIRCILNILGLPRGSGFSDG